MTAPISTKERGLTAAHLSFLRRLKAWRGIATSQRLGPQTSQIENSARQTCKRRGLVTFDRGVWELTPAGRRALSELWPEND